MLRPPTPYLRVVYGAPKAPLKILAIGEEEEQENEKKDEKKMKREKRRRGI